MSDSRYPERAYAGDWAQHAACKDMPKALFFPGPFESSQPAREICAGCPVRRECLDAALENREEHGIFGGLSTQQRRRIGFTGPKRVKTAECGTDGGYNRHLRVTHTEPCQACKDAHAAAHRDRKMRESIQQREKRNARKRELDRIRRESAA